MPILPDFLTAGDLILVISPSGKVDRTLFLAGCKIIEGQGFKVEIGPNALNSSFKFAGTHQERLADLQWAIDHPSAKAIFCARGGYGATYLLDSLDWTSFKGNPKWIVGYSDITALHHAVFQQDICSIHGPVLQALAHADEGDKQALFGLLMGKSAAQEISGFPEFSEAIGEQVVGGNLSMIINQIGTPTEISFSRKILFLEEVGESLYHIDRMILQLKRSGKLKELKALIVGDFSEIKETKAIFGQDVHDIIANHCAVYEYPILYNFPLGHAARNWPLVHGAKYRFSETFLEGPIS